MSDHAVYLRRFALAFTPLVALAAAAADDGPSVSWVPGPGTVSLGSQAEIALGSDHAFAGAADTQRLMESMGNSVSKREVGLITPRASESDWILVFEYHDVGYVKDDEKDKIDKNALFESIRDGTEAANERRKKMGVPGLHVTHWVEEPHYDASTHNLVWALAAKDDSGASVVNYNMRVLGREGYMSVTLVDDPAKLAASRVEAAQLMTGFQYKSGKTYAEFRPGDKVSEYGLVALVAAGAGAGAAKLGLFAKLAKLLAKGGKAVVAFVVLAAAGLRAAFARLFRRNAEAG